MILDASVGPAGQRIPSGLRRIVDQVTWEATNTVVAADDINAKLNAVAGDGPEANALRTLYQKQVDELLARLDRYTQAVSATANAAADADAGYRRLALCGLDIQADSDDVKELMLTEQLEAAAAALQAVADAARDVCALPGTSTAQAQVIAAVESK